MRRSRQERPASQLPPVVGRGRFALRSLVKPVLDRPGQRLDGETRRAMDNRLGHDFSRVRIHSDAAASRSARALGTRAYTVGSHVVADRAALRPGSATGLALLAHELTHVVQQGGHRSTSATRGGISRIGGNDAAEQEARRAQAGGVVSPQPVAGPVLQREEPDEQKKKVDQQAGIPSPEPEQPMPWPGPEQPSLISGGLQVDPMLMLRINQMLARERIQAGLYKLDLETLDRLYPMPLPGVTPQPPAPEEKPAVPAGKGPDKPREGKPGDVLKAVTKIPAVDGAINKLKDDALGRVKRDWRKRSILGKVTLVSSLVLVGGTAVGSIMAHDKSRTAALGFIKDKNLPVPGVPGLSMQLNLVGPDLGVRFGLNVGSLLPKNWGFK